MNFDFKKMSFNQLAILAGGVFVVVMVVTAIIISAANKKPPMVATKYNPTQFETSSNDIVIEQMRDEIKQLKNLIDSNAQTSKAAFAQTAAAIDEQSNNINILDANLQLTGNRINNLENARLGARVNIVKPEDQLAQPTRAERLSALQGNAKNQTKALTLSSEGSYKPLAKVGNRAWISNGTEEFSVAPGETLTVNGPLVVKEIMPNGQVSVSAEFAR